MLGTDTVEEYWSFDDIKTVKPEKVSHVKEKLSEFLACSPESIKFDNSGRACIVSILSKLNNITKKRGVLISNFNCSIVKTCVESANCKPYFYEFSPEKFILGADVFDDIELDEICAIIVPHFFGFYCDFSEILSICNKNKIFIIEDCAHYLSTDNSSRVKSDFAIYSFNYDKPISLLGGGLLIDYNNILNIQEPDFLSFELGRDVFFSKYKSLVLRRNMICLFKFPFVSKVLRKILHRKLELLGFETPISLFQISFLFTLLREYRNVEHIRIRNYMYLKGRNKDYFFSCDSDFSPLKLRFINDDKSVLNEVVRLSGEANIRVGNFNWPVPLSQGDNELMSHRMSMLGLDIPIHQNMTQSQLNKIKELIGNNE